MRGADQPQTALFSYLSVEDRIPADHPLRAIHALITPILAALPQTGGQSRSPSLWK